MCLRVRGVYVACVSMCVSICVCVRGCTLIARDQGEESQSEETFVRAKEAMIIPGSSHKRARRTACAHGVFYLGGRGVLRLLTSVPHRLLCPVV
mmetsp:Transcript_36870/g.54114  ORF Transcript_36870/g.54114 Transcript_36870/m.54114 type:complete len:94 (-) Transcript_36870:411-692(-)